MPVTTASVAPAARDDQQGRFVTGDAVGFVSDEKDLYDYMTVEEMIRFTAPFFSRWFLGEARR